MEVKNIYIIPKISKTIINNTLAQINLNDSKKNVNNTVQDSSYPNKISTIIEYNDSSELSNIIKDINPLKESQSISSIEKINNRLVNVTNKPLTFRLPYPHTALSSFSKAFRDFIHYRIYDNFKDILFGSYNRAFQSYFQRIKAIESGDQMIDIGLPLFNYTIQIESPDEKTEMPWRSTTYFPGVSKVLFPSFYKDDEIELKVVYRRLKGNINANIYCSSEAELLDLQMAFYDGFRGLNKFNSTMIRNMTILPNEMLFIDSNGKRISKALQSNRITKSFIPNINNTCYYIHNNSDAIIQMTNLSESNNNYGGASLAEYILSGTFNFEIDIPQYILCLTKEVYSGIEINLDVQYNYSDDKVLDSIYYITGNRIDTNYNNDPNTSKFIIPFENGNIIDRTMINLKDYDNSIVTKNNDNLISIDFDSIFNKDNTNPKDFRWSYKNRDIVVFILYPGGVIRIPFDSSIAEFDESGKIIFKIDLFKKDDMLELIVFQLTKDINV